MKILYRLPDLDSTVLLCNQLSSLLGREMESRRVVWSVCITMNRGESDLKAGVSTFLAQALGHVMSHVTGREN